MRSALATVESRCAITSTVKSFIILSRASWTTASLSESRALVACMWCDEMSECRLTRTRHSAPPCQEKYAQGLVWHHQVLPGASTRQERAVTSSNNSTVGFLTSALAMAMRCFCPPDSDTPFSPQSCMFMHSCFRCNRHTASPCCVIQLSTHA